ncbi:MAG: DUF2840 domain-containing protein [Afipia sp.]|jgi:hypothetical protein|uniref:DUF2840 domain-containing protein n=1 Tax=Bradyrhizobium denitrificans TaxID=2734912 RepID=A0ABS5GCT7_9BRAD|nr:MULTISPECIES: DUF2840 domain-containing protein [Alphaproteobacteria]MBN9581605.1 DUF2840 domain-containing protein [Afipia sp.]MBS0473534.1 DUF2840 domain-containing protein [Pseudomonadota bacterium]TXH81572.1 MAG: DUF2840 domain-containing protein [Rhizobium sp.]HVV39540.1 DUF2840 domain-containing protein [Nitrobacter sp.]MBP8233140.1 DUF2840 domain-containing protein [Rhizorhabdus sp.]
MTADLRASGPTDHTLVELTWREKRIEHRIRFGHIVDEQRLDRHRRIVSFVPGSIFAFVRWAANEYGTIISRIDILRTVTTGEPYQTLPFVRPGGDILLRISGWPKVQRVLAAIDAIEALDIDPADVAPEHWRHLNHRISVNEPFRIYSPEQHRAWLLRREVSP